MRQFLTILTLALLCCLSAARGESVLTLKTGHFTIEVDFHPQANLIYQLDCLTQVGRCTSEVFERLWRQELALNANDQALLDEWASIRKKFGDADGAKDPTLPVKASYPIRVDDDGRPWNKLRWAEFRARDRAELKRIWSALMAADAADCLLKIFDAFGQRFDLWWSDHESEAKKFISSIADSMRQARAAEILAATARLYRSELEDRHVFLHLMLQPKSKDGHSRATRIGAHMVVEILPDEQAVDRVDVIVHELAHHIFGRMPTTQKVKLVDALLATGSTGVPAWILFDEVQATVIGNYLADRNALTPERFQRKLDRPLSLYNEELIDLGARATVQVFENALKRGRVLPRTFPEDFVGALRAGLGEKLDAPSLHLRSMVMGAAEWRSPWLAKIHAGVVASRPRTSISAWRLAPLASPEFTEKLAQHLGLSAVVVAFSDQVPQLAPASRLLGVTPEALTAALGDSRGVVFVAPRTPAAYSFVFVARDELAMDGLIAAFPSCRLDGGVCARIE